MAKTVEIVAIKPIEMNTVEIEIKGDTPLIMHAWSEKAKKMMLDAQQGKTKGKKKDVKNPVEDFINSMYWLTEQPSDSSEEAFEKAIASGAKFGFPVTAFKQAAISAAYRMGWVKDKMGLRGAFFIESDFGDMIEIKSDPPIMREDMVKIGMGTADLRYRGEFRNWSAVLRVKYNINGQFSLENILNIINAGGTICGVGEWRPEKDGQFGMFHIVTD
ncbi:MAG: hypothetical protein IIZ62_00410 [Ruminococcus sp.]|nr:hypothetical protein [Ruminococcus sp.]